jgi:hypothetical protein
MPFKFYPPAQLLLNSFPTQHNYKNGKSQSQFYFVLQRKEGDD